jgi:hypothetical protein
MYPVNINSQQYSTPIQIVVIIPFNNNRNIPSNILDKHIINIFENKESAVNPLINKATEDIFNYENNITPYQERFETAFASESSLAKDWLSPEEDEIWMDL